jgi:hypothetical protein
MRSYIISVAFILLTFSSCLTIMQSLITPDNIITDKRIEGIWSRPGSKNVLVEKFMDSKFQKMFTDLKNDWKYTKQDSIYYTKHYVISFLEENITYTWLCGIVKIQDQYFLNLKPEDILNDSQNDVNIEGEPLSSIAKIEWKNDNSLVLRFLNGTYIKEIILSGKARIKHEYDSLFNTFVITASSSELEQFLTRYGDRDDLYNGGETIILTRKK